MFTMEPRYCNYYKIENGREICTATKTAPVHCRKCAFFKSELYTPSKDDDCVFSLEKFKAFEYIRTAVRSGCSLKISPNQRSASLTKAAADLLNDPDYVQIFINNHDKQIAIKRGRKDSPHAIKVGKSRGNRILYCVSLARELSKYGISANGEYDKVNDAIVFSFGKDRR